MARRGFTLVEIMIVVFILVILAAIVIPQFSTASNDTRDASALTNLKTLRMQLQLYKAEHNDNYPTDFETQMKIYSDAQGNTSDTFSSTYRFGHYIQEVPDNPYTGVNTVTTVTGIATAYTEAADLSQGWWYNSTTGEIRCHVPNSKITNDGRQVNQL